MTNLMCTGPGPHQPTTGILGDGDHDPGGLLCPPCAVLAVTAAAPAVAAAAAAAAAVAADRVHLNNLHGNVPAWHTQLQADIATVTPGWQTLTAQQQTDIMLRMLNGFGTAMAGLLDHATITGAITPT